MNNDVSVKVKVEQCTGCCVCQNICPVDAITMCENGEGFIHPVINETKCVDCGLCTKKCPVLEPSYFNEKNPECRAVWAKDEIRMTAASGGVFSAFAEVILKRGGVVCGAAFNDDFSVSHLMAENLEDLSKLKSSKYAQSNAGLIYRKVKEQLEEGKEVLFSGCPCQVAGLYSFLGSSTIKNLYTMDIVCHGVPSSKVLRKYLDDNYKIQNIEKVEFRNKDVFGWSSSMTVGLKDGTVQRKSHAEDSFYQAFLKSLAVRKSCSQCKFSCIPRQGDLTIGDFWGISRYKQDLNDRKGTSLVLVNNAKGQSILKQCRHDWIVDEKVPIDVAIASNHAIVGSFREHPARRRFFENIDIHSMNKLVNDCLTHHYDVGIVGVWYGLNYGSILTYYALNKVITDLGYQCIMVNKPKQLWDNRFEDRNSVANQFIYRNCYVSNIRTTNHQWEELNDHCDMFVVGSDVIWNYNICGRQAGHFFFLDFVNHQKKKIAYAASFGSGISTIPEYETMSRYYLSRFDHISLREKDGVKLLQDRYQLRAEQVLDPVFLCNINYFLKAAEESSVRESASYVASYFLAPGPRKRNALLTLCRELNLEYRNLYNPNENFEMLEKRLGLPLLHNVSVEDWLYYMKNCEFFIGDSFHGLCFSLIFRKPFIVMIDIDLPSRNRFDSLLGMLGLKERIVDLDVKPDAITSLLHKEIDYNAVAAKLDLMKDKSLAWLKDALSSPKVVNRDATDYMLEKLIFKINELEDKINNLTQK